LTRSAGRRVSRSRRGPAVAGHLDPLGALAAVGCLVPLEALAVAGCVDPLGVLAVAGCVDPLGVLAVAGTCREQVHRSVGELHGPRDRSVRLFAHDLDLETGFDEHVVKFGRR